MTVLCSDSDSREACIKVVSSTPELGSGAPVCRLRVGKQRGGRVHVTWTSSLCSDGMHKK